MALEFNGTTQKVEKAATGLLDVTRITVCGWLKMAVAQAEELTMVAMYDGTHDEFYISIDASGLMTFTVWLVGGPVSATLSGWSADSTWRFFACTYDGSQVRIRMNGSATTNAAIGTGNIVPAAAPFTIGAEGDGFNWKGQLEDIRMYSRALSQPEQQSIYNGGAGGGSSVDGVTSGLKANWKLIGPTDSVASGANSVLDSAVNSLHATPSNSPIYRSGLIALPSSGSGGRKQISIDRRRRRA